MTHSDDSMHDIDALRAFASTDSDLPLGFEERMSERMWRLVLAEEQRLGAQLRTGTSSKLHRSRLWHAASQWMRPAFGAGLVAVIVVFVMMAANRPRPGDGVVAAVNGSVSSAGALSQAAITNTSTLDALLGRQSTPAAVHSPATGVIDATSNAADIPEIAEGPGNASATLVAQLPRDERALISLLRQSTASDSTAHDRDFEPFRVAASWIGDASAPADLRAAFLRSLAYIDGIEAVGRANDSFGRPGVIIARLDQRSGVRQEYVVAPQGGTLLEHREYTTRLDDPVCPAGTLVAFDAFDATGNRIDEASTRWVAWPMVVDSCDPGR